MNAESGHHPNDEDREMSCDPARTLRAVEGYIALGLHDLGREELHSLPWFHYKTTEAQNHELDMLMGEARWEHAAERGRMMERDGLLDYKSLSDTALAMNNAGQTGEALALTERHPELSTGDDCEAYSLAVYLCAAGRLTEALANLQRSLTLNPRQRHRMLSDTELARLWQHLNNDAPLGEDEALLLANPCWDAWLADADGNTEPLPLDVVDLVLHPRFACLCVFRRTTGQMHPEKAQGAKHPAVWKGLLAWQRSRVLWARRSIRRAIRRAQTFMLERQLPWAAEAAARGDWMALRYHLIFALASKPSLAAELPRHPGLKSARWFWQALVDGETIRPGFCKLITRIEKLTREGDGDAAMSALDRLPQSLKSNPLYMLRTANAWNEKCCYDQAIELWIRVLKAWPHDPAVHGNLMDAYARLGRWDLAETVMTHLPPAFDHLRNASLRRECVRKRDWHRAFSLRPFYGQRDLGGIVMEPR